MAEATRAVPVPMAAPPAEMRGGARGSSEPHHAVPEKAFSVSSLSRSPASIGANRTAVAAPVDEATQAEQWRDALPTGSIKHHIDPVMELEKPSTVTVTIEGDKAAPSALQAGESAIVPLKVSYQMMVTLSAPGHEDQFKIDLAGSQQKTVLHGGATVWTWKVTPQHEGDGTLQIDAYVLYQDSADRQIPLPSIVEKVHVKSIPPKIFLESGWDWVQEHPGQSLKYILPGGAGAAMLHQLVLWWQRRRKSAAGEAAPKEGLS